MLRHLRLRLTGRLLLGRHVTLGPHTRLNVTGRGTLTLEDGVSIGARARFDVPGGHVRIGARTRIGDGFVVVAHERVEIAPDVSAGDDVVVQDVARVFADPERPIREQGLVTAPVAIGPGVVLGARAVVERGVTIGEGAVVEAGALVTRDVPAAARAEGVPARAVR